MTKWLRKLFGEAEVPSPAPAVPPPVVVRFDLSDPRVPQLARGIAAQVLATIFTLTERDSNGEFDRVVLGELEQIRDEHLPKLLRSFVDIPAEHRKVIFKNTGRSASFLLEESLGKIAARVEALSRDLAQNEIEAFSSNTDFIARRYSDIEDPFA
jgi:hypothetical protein